MFKSIDFFILGNFGYLSEELDGQVVKTREIHKLFVKNSGTYVLYFDTDRLKKNKLNIFALLLNLLRIKNLIYLPAGNNLKWFFPVLFTLSQLLHFKIHYFVIGGWLPNFIQKHKNYKIGLKRIDSFYVETNDMLNKLKIILKHNNVIWFPNFRFCQTSLKVGVENDILKLVYMSRINKMKGIEMVINFAEETLLDISIDFYGPIHAEDKDYFEEKIRTCEKMCYKGMLEPEQIHNTLSAYDILLLPTKYFTEGLPGAIVDAYFAGIPVIVTKWQCAEEFVASGITGFIIPFEDGYERIKEYIELLYYNRDLLRELKLNAFNYSSRFTSDKAWQIISNTMLTR